MEAKRNLEIILKRRLEESEKVRRQTELYLMVVKQYLTLLNSGDTKDGNQDIMDILNNIDKLHQKLKNILSGYSGEHAALADYDEAMKLAKLQLDEIHFHPKSIFSDKIIDVVSDIFNVDKNNIVVGEQLQQTCLSLDYKVLIKILHTTIKLFTELIKDYKLSLLYDKTNSLLKIVFNGESLRSLQNAFNVADSIFKDQITIQTTFNDLHVLAFINKALCQCTGGDANIVQIPNFGLELTVSAELVPNEQCKLIEQPKINIPKLDKPLKLDKTEDVQIIESKPTTVPSPIIPPVSSPIVSPIPISETGCKKSIEGKELTILLGEDNKSLQDLFKRYWYKKGHKVLIASDGQEAIEIFKQKPISIIFLDIEMPFKKGYEVAKEIRAFEVERHLPRTPIIGLSGYELKNYKDIAIESGMDDFLSKSSGYPYQDIYKMAEKYCGE